MLTKKAQNHVGVSSFHNIIANQIKMFAFLGLNYGN